jgi:hypothetical protein
MAARNPVAQDEVDLAGFGAFHGLWIDWRTNLYLSRLEYKLDWSREVRDTK